MSKYVKLLVCLTLRPVKLLTDIEYGLSVDTRLSFACYGKPIVKYVLIRYNAFNTQEEVMLQYLVVCVCVMFLSVEQFRQGLSYVGVGLPRAAGPTLGNARFKITAKVLIAHLKLQLLLTTTRILLDISTSIV